LELVRKIGSDRRRQALALAVCANDPVYWVNQFVWTYDPRERVATIPFDLFPRQEEFLLWLVQREELQEGGLAEKSRDVGFTWLCCAFMLHRWLFRDGFQGGFGSRKLGLVDTLGDPSSIFEKLRIILRNLPAWMMPAGFSWTDHDNLCKLLNPANGASLTGEGGDNIGRGGRASVYVVDEAAFLERARTIDAALSQTSRCKIYVSTPNGSGNPFFTKRFSGKYPVFTFRWQDDPRKDQAWYQAQCDKYDPVTVAQEIDIDYTASIEGITIPAKWVMAAVDLALPGDPEPYEPDGPIVAGYDVAEDGKDKNVIISRQGPLVLSVVDWSQLNTTQSAHRAADEAERLDVSRLFYDCVGVGAGIRGTLDSSDRKLRFAPEGINGGESPTQTRWPGGKRSCDLFINLRAELWWILRARFEKAFEYRELGIAHPASEMISIPNHSQLIADLSLPISTKTESGKIRLESKKDMRARGIKSPDFGDALAYAYAPGKRQWNVG
jgi:phage terminase large subunit